MPEARKVTLPFLAEVRVTVDLETGKVVHVEVAAELEPDERETGYFAVDPDPGEDRERYIAQGLELCEQLAASFPGWWLAKGS